MEGSIGARRARKPFQQHLRELWRQRDLQVMIFPWMLLVIVFAYIPLYGLIIAFQDYRLGDAIGFSRWAGLENFRMFFNSPDFWPIMRNTFAISFLKMLFAFPAPIILALMLNEVRGIKFKRSVQTISYLPYFISWVVVAGLTLDFLKPDGSINSLLMSLNIIDSPIAFMNEAKYFWGVIVVTDIWKGIGWNAIIYIAAIASINPELYQAADIDGAGRMRKVWHITMSGIKPTVVILLILTTGSIIQSSFDQVMLLTNNLQNTLVYERSEILDTHILRVGMRNMRYSYATAAGLFRSFVSVALLLSANFTAKKLSDESLF
ncbi:MAG: ABC transporter permease subunit [Oscillospiraceae bacterium]|nr:ABC transporter permease subunit [Oscillospiraceae bacterium]